MISNINRTIKNANETNPKTKANKKNRLFQTPSGVILYKRYEATARITNIINFLKTKPIFLPLVLVNLLLIFLTALDFLAVLLFFTIVKYIMKYTI